MTETIAEYVSELRRLTKIFKYCEFLEQSLRDGLVCSICMHVPKQLLSEPEVDCCDTNHTENMAAGESNM